MTNAAFAALAAALLLPVFMLVGVAVLLIDGAPILYRSERVGLRGRRFKMLKFRTMYPGADRIGVTSTADDDPRITRLGTTLRRYKLDELPQLWNVLVGEMSFVGPRPQVPCAVERYTDHEKILLSVRPGITDPASLRFANEGEILRGHADPDKAYFELIHPEKMRLSRAYVKNRTFFGDIKILVATLGAALGRPTPPPRLPGQLTSTK